MADIQHGGISGSASLIQRISGSIEKGGGGRKEILSNTTEAWNSTPLLQSVKDVIYVYTDHKIVEGHPIPAIKVGDGLAYLIDLPFVACSDITDEQIDFWNNKCSVMIDPKDPEHLIFYTDQR